MYIHRRATRFQFLGNGFQAGLGKETWPCTRLEKEAPALVVIANPQDLINPDLGVHFASGLGAPLRALDYRHSFAVLVLQGLKGSGGYRVNVQQVSRRGNRVTVQAEFIELGPGEGRTLGFTSPYQLIAITKGPAWEPVNRFELLVDGTVVATATHSIP